eukprot:gene19549-33803_t
MFGRLTDGITGVVTAVVDAVSPTSPTHGGCAELGGKAIVFFATAVASKRPASTLFLSRLKETYPGLSYPWSALVAVRRATVLLNSAASARSTRSSGSAAAGGSGGNAKGSEIGSSKGKRGKGSGSVGGGGGRSSGRNSKSPSSTSRSGAGQRSPPPILAMDELEDDADPGGVASAGAGAGAGAGVGVADASGRGAASKSRVKPSKPAPSREDASDGASPPEPAGSVGAGGVGNGSGRASKKKRSSLSSSQSRSQESGGGGDASDLVVPSHISVKASIAMVGRFGPPTTVQLALKSVLMNSLGNSAKHTLESARLGLPKHHDILFEELNRAPGSSWSAYSARRLQMREVEKKLPQKERTIMEFE